MSGTSPFYSRAAHAQMQSLPPKTQLAIEYLRANVLANFIGTPLAHVYNNLNLPINYWTIFPKINTKLFYYEDLLLAREIIIADTKILPVNHNGHP